MSCDQGAASRCHLQSNKAECMQNEARRMEVVRSLLESLRVEGKPWRQPSFVSGFMGTLRMQENVALWHGPVRLCARLDRSMIRHRIDKVDIGSRGRVTMHVEKSLLTVPTNVPDRPGKLLYDTSATRDDLVDCVKMRPGRRQRHSPLQDTDPLHGQTLSSCPT